MGVEVGCGGWGRVWWMGYGGWGGVRCCRGGLCRVGFGWGWG